MLSIGSNSLRGLYKTLYTRVFNNENNKNNYYDSIVSFFMQLNTKDTLPSDEAYVLALKYNNLYRKNALCKYLLTAVENKGKEQLVTDNLTIEHILPQNKNLSTAWQRMLGDKWEEVKDKYLHTLGNLTLTGYNSELGDKTFKEKKELLADNNSKVTTLNKDVMNYDYWNMDTIEKRADNLANMILELYPIVEPENIISFVDPRYKEYK